MCKYIDYDAINYRNDKLHDKSDEFLNGVVYMAQRIEEAPSIDIVRCGECKMWMSEHLCQWWSRYGTVETDADDFCSYGERKEKTE